MKFLSNTARLVVGLLFIFSGFVKAIDPIGSQIIFSEYLKVLHLGFLQGASLGFGVLLSTLELSVGMMLVAGCRIRLASWGALLFMSFFTCLTFYLALFNPIQDCGCFGEFVKLSNWQTFLKNLIILPFVILLFARRNRFAAFASPIAEYTVSGFLALMALCLSLYCYRHLPLQDVMAFAVGNDVPALLEDARENPSIRYETELIYSKDGRTASFDLENLPDSTWTFEDSRTKEVKTGITHKISDFAVRDLDQNYVGDSLLNIPGPMMILALTEANHLRSMKEGALRSLASYCDSENIPFCVISGASEEQSLGWMEREDLQLPLYLSDYKTVLSMIRSNPGLLLLTQGYVTAKWSASDLPTIEEFKNLLAEDPEFIATQTAINERLRMELCLAVAVFLLLLIPWILRKRREAFH